MKILRLIKMILVIAIVVLTISSCTPNKSHNFQVANVEVQKYQLMVWIVILLICI